MEYTLLAWVNAAPTILKQLDSIQNKAAHLVGALTNNLNIYSLSHQYTIAVVSTNWKNNNIKK